MFTPQNSPHPAQLNGTGLRIGIVQARFNADINTALADAEVKRRIEAAGAIAAGPSTPEQVDAFMRSETQRWDRFFREVPIDLT